MTNVTRTSETARPGGAGGEKAGAEPKRGEFDRLLDAKKDAPGEGRPEAHPAHERREHRDGESGGSGQDSSPDQRFHALPGDVAMATPVRWEPMPAATSSVRSAEMVARLEQIAGQIVQAAEVRMGANGTAEAHLDLNLGNLGNVHLALTRGEDGGLRVAFANAGAAAAESLATHAPDLLGRLEARGLAVQEITVQGTDQPDFRLAPAAQSQGGSPADAGGDDPRRQRGFEDERQRRPRPEVELPAEDE